MSDFTVYMLVATGFYLGLALVGWVVDRRRWR